ncbi:hypothetical protein EVJ58_g504 [Rhodofomes roseus]|uniref:Uncharacterized protein n=1 Tax=Rhodofomes roseus TaxID=34475 RepID=A0A4Y9Z358_9APHY|nr:hypothetical protein EVJ58_g504 [Rhodofomes roseus]
MAQKRIYLCHYARNGDAAKEEEDHPPRHWEINIRMSKDVNDPFGKSIGHVFHVVGSVGNQWVFKHLENKDYSQTRAWAGCVFVGTVEESKIGEFERVLASVPLQPGHPTWNCQNWAWDALLLLRQQGYNIVLPPTFRRMHELMEDAKNIGWDIGTDSD